MSDSYVRYPTIGGGAVWGDITGLLSDQTDLQDALDLKLTAPDPGASGQVPVLNGTGGATASANLSMASDILTIGVSNPITIKGGAGGLFSVDGVPYFGGGGSLGMYMQKAMIAYPDATNIGVLQNTTHYPFAVMSSSSLHLGYAQGDTKVAVSGGSIKLPDATPLALLAASGVNMPTMTTTAKNAISSPTAGRIVFDTTLGKLCVYSGAAWETITSV